MLSLVPALLLLQGPGVTHQIPIPNNPNIVVQVREDRLEPPRIGPKIFGEQRWEFDWLTTGFGNLGESGVLNLRLRVYSQERKSASDKAAAVARMLMQLWDRSFHRYKLDHPLDANNGIVDVFLCFGGQPGGEQIFEWDPLSTDPLRKKFNDIYIYQLSSFKDPVEMAREVAHEYGHAVLPAVSGFKEPEPWSNGYLGEKLYLRWLRDELVAGRLEPADAMGATAAGLDAWVKKRIDPIVNAVATSGPNGLAINETKAGMDTYIGYALYAEQILPPQLFIRSLRYTVDAHKADQSTPVDYPEQVRIAAGEVENLTLAVPAALVGKKIWIPLGKGNCPAATILQRDKRTGWAQVVPATASIVIKNPPVQ